jgi:hypothetical protein
MKTTKLFGYAVDGKVIFSALNRTKEPHIRIYVFIRVDLTWKEIIFEIDQVYFK